MQHRSHTTSSRLFAHTVTHVFSHLFSPLHTSSHLFQSVAVARRGMGSMAVSSATGSQVANILIGLGVPWQISNALGMPVTMQCMLGNTTTPICNAVVPSGPVA